MALKLWGFESPPPHHDNGSEERSISSGIDRCFVAIRKDRVVLFDCLGISLPGFRDSHFAVSEDAGTRTSPQRMHHYHVSRLAGGTLPKARQRPGPPHRAPVGSTVLRGLFLGGLRNAGEVRVSHVQALRGGQGGPEGERQPFVWAHPAGLRAWKSRNSEP